MKDMCNELIIPPLRHFSYPSYPFHIYLNIYTIPITQKQEVTSKHSVEEYSNK